MNMKNIFMEKEINGVLFLVDKDNNKVNLKTFNKEVAIEMLESLLNCKECVNCENCEDCENLIFCHDCIFTNNSVSCAFLTACEDCVKCENLLSCKDCYFLKNEFDKTDKQGSL
jgi:hypothetical protein